MHAVAKPIRTPTNVSSFLSGAGAHKQEQHEAAQWSITAIGMRKYAWESILDWGAKNLKIYRLCGKI